MLKYLKDIYSNGINIGHIWQRQGSTSECCCVYFEHRIYRKLCVCCQRQRSIVLPDLHLWLVIRRSATMAATLRDKLTHTRKLSILPNYEVSNVSFLTFPACFLIKNIFFQFEYQFFQCIRSEKPPGTSYIYNWCQDLSFRRKLRPCKSC